MPKKDKRPNSDLPDDRGPTQGSPSKVEPEKLTVVGIGASAGGLLALQTFFDALPSDTGMAFVVVTHLDPERESLLGELLQTHTRMPVRQVTKMVPVEPDHVYVIPPNRSIAMTDTHLNTAEFHEPRGMRTPIDDFFRSLASAHREAIAVILSGGGTDGAVGVKTIKEQGGLLLVQHPAEAEHDSMPRAAIATGLADMVLPVHELAGKLIEYRTQPIHLPRDPEALTAQEIDTLNRILTQVLTRTGHDFSQYKRATVLRRIQRRMQLNGYATLDAYLGYLRYNTNEAFTLFSDLLIGVTNFFRDRESWEALADKVIPRLFEGKGAGDTVRAWTIGCSTGEEAYTLAILLIEQLDKQEIRPVIQIFASDLDENALLFARAGLYPAAIEADVSPERLKRFFIRSGDHYRVRRELRDVVLFADHSVLRDPPFSRLEMVACRNLLIYLERELQDNLFEIYHYALKPGGYLFLGGSESAESANELFHTVDKTHRIYQARPWRGEHPNVPRMPQVVRRSVRQGVVDTRAFPGQHLADTPGSIERLHKDSLEEFGPASILVDQHYHVLHLSETAGRYLRHPRGPLTSEVLNLVRPELQYELRMALFAAFEKDQAVIGGPVHVHFNGDAHPVVLSVQPRNPVADPEQKQERLALVLFLEDQRDEAVLGEAGKPEEGGSAEDKRRQPPERQIEKLEYELHQLREQLRANAEEYESSSEELKAANEELQSINEEYRSTTEELETSKEELQSVNEELQTVNNELKSKLEEISLAHSDLENLIAATEIATLFLDRDLRIKWFTRGMEQLFNIMASDRGRPIAHLTNRLGYEQLEEDIHRVLQKLATVEREVRGLGGEWFLMHLRPYRTIDDRIDGVVITFVDISKLKNTEIALREREAELAQAQQTLEERVEMRTHELHRRTQEARELASQLTMAEQDVRYRLSRVLHDDLQQRLYAMEIQLKFMHEAIDSQDMQAALEEISQLSTAVVEAIRITRSLSVELSPPILHDEGLSEALNWLAVQMKDQYGLEVEVRAAESFPLHDTDLRILLFQSVRELLFNIVKHANASKAGLRLERDDSKVRIEVSDNGQGFNPETVRIGQQDGGLSTLRRRLELFGGDLQIQSHTDSGTLAIIISPLSRPRGDG